MLKTILLPLDGSPLAERARTYATLLARRSGASIKLVQAVQAYTPPGTDPSEAQVEVTQCAEEYLSTAADRLLAEGIKAEPHVYYDEPVPAILDAANRQHADMIVMSTHGRGGIARMLYGSVADQILRRSTVPVLVVPSIVDHGWPADDKLSVLVPLDGSELAEEALLAVNQVKDAFGARLMLLRVVPPVTSTLHGPSHAYVPFNEDLEVAAAQRYVDHEAAQLTARGYDVKTIVVVGDPARAIGNVAREQRADLIAMATHGKGGLSRLILGSVATATLRHTTVPLLLIRPLAMHHPAAEETRTMPFPMQIDGSPSAPTPTAAPVAAPPEPSATEPLVSVQLTASEAELIARSLKALGHAPGFDYSHILAARALAEKIAKVYPSSSGRQPAISH
ncbi:MAG: universal stress protein [Chloroflexi bacterium]|nr:universal stress protein [Chloroflexota bacterium]